MWVEELSIENIRCFKSATLRFASGDARYPWVTFLSENGGGKTTALQALGLLLAGPEGAQKLVPRPVGWLRVEGTPGKIGRGYAKMIAIRDNTGLKRFGTRLDTPIPLLVVSHNQSTTSFTRNQASSRPVKRT